MPLIALCILFLCGTIITRSSYLFVDRIEFVEDSVVLNKKLTEESVSKTLQVNIFPVLANNKDVEFWSEDESIVTIDQNGKITSQNFGETYVFVKSKENGTKRASCKVLVTSDSVHRIWAESPISTIYVGDTPHNLNIKFEPIGASDINYTLTSSSPNVVYVSPNGELVARSKGEAIITVYVTSNPDVNYSFKVNSKIKVERIYINETSPVFSGQKEFTFPQINFEPENAEEKITYLSSDPSIATIDDQGKITFAKAGEIVITAKVENFKSDIQKTYESTYGYVKDISFSSQNLREINFEDYQDKDLQLLWSCRPADADMSNISFTSSDENVIKVEGGALKVVGGGWTTISMIAKTSAEETKTATLKIFVNRKIERLELGKPSFSYTSLDSLNITTSIYPQDATEKVEYTLFDSSLARFENGRLVFTSKTLNNKFAKVKLTASTPSGVSKTITIVYIDSSIRQIKLTTQTKLNFVMPKTTDKAQNIFALIVDEEQISDVQLKIESGGENISQNEYIFTLTSNGNAQVGVYLNGQTSQDRFVDLVITREVEEIKDIKIIATWDNGQRQEFAENQTIYSSSKTFEFEYSLYPQNTTQTCATAEIEGDYARIIDGKIEFIQAGKVKLVLSSDGVTKKIEIESTYLHPDKNTIVEESINLTKGQTISIFDCINISPLNVDKNFVTFQKDSEVISLDASGNIKGICGGEAVVDVMIATANENVSKQISVYVEESAENVLTVGDKYIFSQQSSLNILNKFKVVPKTANKNNSLTYSVENSDIASINSNGVLSFKKEGHCVVIAKLGEIAIAKIGVVYAENSIILNGGTQNFKVLKGTKIVIKPSGEALSRANFDEGFLSSNSGALVENKIFITINGDTNITFSGEQYVIDCVDKIGDVSILPLRGDDVDEDNGNLITGLTQIQLSGNVTAVSHDYLVLNYDVDDQTIASISNDGLLTFKKMGKVVVQYNASYKTEIVGSEGITKSSTILIESTFGQITKVVPVGDGNYNHTFDNENSLNNKVDVKSYLQAYPTQISLNSQNIKLNSSSTSIAGVDGLNLSFNKGGEVEIEVQIAKGDGYIFGTRLNFSVSRSATGIILNDKIISSGDEITVHKSTIFLKTESYPADANVDCEISFEVIDNNNVAEIENNKIRFKKVNEPITIKFTLGEGENASEYLVYIKTTIITFEVDVESQTYIVPMSEPFTFVSNDELMDLQVDFSDDFTQIQNIATDVYTLNETNKGNLTISYNGITKTVPFISTTNIQEIEGVKLKDYNMQGGVEQIETTENELCLVTASTSVEVLYDIPVGYDKFGNQIDYSLSVRNGNVAQITNKSTINFSTEGVAEVLLSISFEDAYQQRTLSYLFSVQSTYQQVTQFSISKTDYNLIYDNLTEEQRVIDVLQNVTREAPVYGNVLNGTIISKNENVVSVANNKVCICGSGNGTVEITWGKSTKTINFDIDKYIDRIDFVESCEIISQIVTKSNTYKLNYIFTQTNTDFKETLKDVTFSTTSGCTIVDGVVELNSENERYEVTVSAVGGTASAKLIIIFVSSDVNIIKADSELSDVVIKKDVVNIFDFRFNNDVVSISQLDGNMAFVNSEIQTFKGLQGASGDIYFDNNQNVNYIITEDVEEIRFKADAITDNYLTAMGDSEDNKGIDLFEAYGAYAYPETSRNEQGRYAVNYSVANFVAKTSEPIAYIENGVLYFTRQGKVVITFTAGGKSETRTIESTMGYANAVTFKENSLLVLELTEQSYSLPSDFYSVCPSDAYKQNVTLSSDETEVLNVSNDLLNLVGGGKTNLNLTYFTAEGQSTTIKREIYVKNRVSNIKIYDGKNQVGYMVKNNAVNSTMSLDYQLISNGQLSAYNIFFASTNESVAKINDNGVVTFVGDGETIITVKVQEKLDGDNEETKNNFDAVCQFKLINRENYDVIKVESDDDITLEFDNDKPCILYPISNKHITSFDFVSSNNGVVSISSLGEITKVLGGEAKISISSSQDEEFSKQVLVYIYRNAEINISIDEIYQNTSSVYDVYTAKTEFEISSIVSITPADALVRKTIEYVSSDPLSAEIENGVVNFNLSNGVTIAVNVLYNGVVEKTASFTIYSSLGKVESFEVSGNSCSLYTNDTPAIFTISNIAPKDYVGTVAEIYFSSTNSLSYSVTPVDWKSFKVTPIKSGEGEFTVRYNSASSTIYERIEVEVKQLSTSLAIQHDNKTITSLKTFEDTINLNALIGPTDTTNKHVTWDISVESGSATYSVDANKAQISFSDYGKVVIIAKAQDGGADDCEVIVEYVRDIEGFELTTNQVNSLGNTNTVTFVEDVSGQIAYLEWNQTEITFKISVLPTTNFVGFNDYSNFSITTQNGKTATIDNYGNFTITTSSIAVAPIYEDIIHVGYSAKYQGEMTIKIYRDGLQSINFGNHNSTKDEECGLQQMRVFGFKSYYNGAIQNYYRMDVNILNNNVVVSTNGDTQPNFANEVVWETNNDSVTIQTIGKGYIDINFSQISTKNSFDDIYNFDSATSELSKGIVTIYAKNKSGRILCSYTFKIVDAINIFDEEGYLNAGANIVLQKSFGHTDQQAQIDSGDCVKLQSYVAKTTIYGNGHLMNFHDRNQDTGETSYNDYKNIQVSIQNAINLEIQGSNFDSTYDSYHIELVGVSKLAYCNIYYMYRAIEKSAANSTMYVKNCLFRSLQSSGIILSDSTATGKKLYLENIIMFDVGQRAIEIQAGTAYVKGFLDVYNFQDKNALKKLGSIKIGSLEIGGSTIANAILDAAKSNGLTVKGGDGGTYANIVGISTKSQDIQILYWENGEYVYKTDGSQTQSAPNLKKINGKSWGVNYCAWAYKSYQDANGNNVSGAYLTWEHEFNSDGSLNFVYMSSTTTKISRLGDTINI